MPAVVLRLSFRYTVKVKIVFTMKVVAVKFYVIIIVHRLFFQ